MGITLEIVEAQAMQLSEAERELLAVRLLGSFTPDPEVEAASEQELDRREADIASGQAQWIPNEEAMAELRTKLHR